MTQLAAFNPQEASAKTVVAVYDATPLADAATRELLGSGFPIESMSTLCAADAKGQHFKVVEGNKAADGMVGGGALGGGLGALAAGLVATGVVAAPGLGLVAAGPIVAALAGAGAGAATGGLVGGLVGMGFTEVEAKVVDEQIRNGGVIVAVDCNDTETPDRARAILERHHPRAVASPRP